MNMPLDPETAKRLLDSGNMNPDTYARAFGAPPAAQTFGDSAMAANVAPSAPAGLMADLASMFRSDEGQAKKIAVDAKRKMINQRAEQLKGLGVDEKEIESKLAPQMSELDEIERGLLLTGEKPLSEQQTPDVLLTSDMPQTPAQVAQTDMAMNPAMTAAYDLQQQAVAQAAQAGMAKAAETSAAIEQTNKDLEKMRAANEAARVADQEALAAEQNKLAAEVDRVANLKVDPGRFWANKSTADKVLLGASLFLGAFGAANTGVNQAANVIGNAIKQDLDLQQADIAQQTRGVDRRRGILADMKSRFRDDAMARNAAEVAYLQDSQRNIQAIANKYESPQVQARATQLIGQLELQKQNAQAQFLQKVQALRPVGADATAAELTPELRERFVPGYGLTFTKEQARKANEELIPTINSIKGNIDELLAISNMTGSSISPEQRAKANTISSILIGQLRLPIVGPGAVSEKELELLQTIIADPTRIFSLDSNNKTRLRTLRERMDKQTANQLKQFGLVSTTDKLGFKPMK